MASPNRGEAYELGRRSRWTVLLAIIAWSVGAGATFYWSAEVFAFLLAPADKQLSPFDGQPIFNSVPDMFGATIGLAMNGGKVAAFPVLTVGLLLLFKPLIPSRFWWFLTIYTALIIGFFLVGASFVYYVMMPVSVSFLLNFGKDVAVPVILLDQYVELLTSLMLWIGFVFLLPIVMNLLAKARLVSYQTARRLRKWVPWVAFILAALITPSFDGFLTMLVAVPMYLLYELGLFTAWLAYPEEGNYLWLGTIGRWLRKVRNGIVWVLRRPVVMKRWVRRKVRGKA